MKDGLEKLFSKYLKEQLPPDDDWNTPSDEVWEKVSGALSGKKERKRPFFWLWLAVILLAVCVLFAIWKMYDIQTEMETVHSREPIARLGVPPADTKTGEPEDVPTQEKTEALLRHAPKESKTVPQKKTKSGICLVDDAMRVSEEKTNAAIESTLNKTQSIASAKVAVATVEREKDEHRVLSSSEYVDEEPLLGNSAVSGLRGRSPLKPLLTKDLKALPLYSNHLRLSIKSLPVVPLATDDGRSEKSDKDFFVYLGAGLSERASPLRGEMSGGFEAMEKSDKIMPAFHAEVKLGKGLGHGFGVFTGLRYQAVNLWSLSSLQTTFDASTETPDAGGYMKSTQRFFVPSQLGMMDAELLLRYPSSLGVSSGDYLEGRMEVTQALHFVQLPLGLSYEQFLGRRFSLVFHLGLAWNKAIHAEAYLQPMVKYGLYEMEARIVKTPALPLSDYWELFSGTSVLLRLDSKNALALHLGYRRALNPHFRQDGMSSRIYGFDLGTGVYHHF